MKRLFKIFKKHYKTGYTYTVKLSDIIIQPGWNYIKTWKMNEKMNYFEKTGRFASTIIIDKDFVLRDGFNFLQNCRNQRYKVCGCIFC